VLSGLVSEVVLGMARELRAASSALHAELRALSTEPTGERSSAAQAAWKRAALAWKRAFAFRIGPFIDSEAFAHAAFWPARPTLIDAVLADREAIDERRVQAQGVDARGLYALEYLLFEEDAARVLRLASEDRGARARAYALELSANVHGYAERIQRLLGDGRSFAERFSAAGQQSVETLLSQALDTLSVVSGKFARVERARSENRPLPFAVEGYYSGTSLDIVLALVAGLRQLYLGGGSGGLSELVAAASKPIDEHVRATFRETERRLRALESPIEVALDAHPAQFRSGADAIVELRHVIEVEMVSALVG